MANPWDKYAGQSGPWSKYSGQTAAVQEPPPPPPKPVDPTDPNGPAWNHPPMETLKNIAMSPIRGLMGIPGQIRDWMDRVVDPSTPREGSLPMGFDEPVSNMMGDAMMAIAPPEGSFRSPVAVGPGRFVQPTSIPGIAEHFMPTSLRVLSRAARGAEGAEPVAAGTLRRLQLQSPLTPELTRPPLTAPPADIPPGPGERTSSQPWEPRQGLSESRRVYPPVWQGMPESQPSPLGPIEPIAPPAGYIRRTPVPPVGSKIPDEELGITTPQAPTAPTTGAKVVVPPPEDMKPMDVKEAHRYAHAQATEAELPGSPAGTSKGAHDWLSKQATVRYGVKNWHELSPAQMQDIGNDLLEQNRVRAKAARYGTTVPPVK